VLGLEYLGVLSQLPCPSLLHPEVTGEVGGQRIQGGSLVVRLGLEGYTLYSPNVSRVTVQCRTRSHCCWIQARVWPNSEAERTDAQMVEALPDCEHGERPTHGKQDLANLGSGNLVSLRKAVPSRIYNLFDQMEAHV